LTVAHKLNSPTGGIAKVAACLLEDHLVDSPNCSGNRRALEARDDNRAEADAPPPAPGLYVEVPELMIASPSPELRKVPRSC